MTTLENRPKTALLVVDVQNGVVEGNHRRDAVVANVGSLVEKARKQDVPVVWVQHNDDNLTRGSDEWKIVPELSPDLIDLRDALAALPLSQRQVIVLHHLVGLPVEEVASELRLATGTVKSRLARGRAAMASTLQLDRSEVT